MGCGASQSGQLVHMSQPVTGVDNSQPWRGVSYETRSVQTEPPVEALEALNLKSQPGGAEALHHGSPYPVRAPKETTDPEDVWLQVHETLDVPKKSDNSHKELIVKRSGWKTIRIFVSSTFKDFQTEREILVKEVFPDLRAWCETRRLHLVDCDLRWGIPKDTTTELTLRTCLGEIDRCYEDNIMPYFLNMTSERIGWIPLPSEVPQNLVEEYRWIFGLSVTEMEIVHGAYRKDNPNSLFILRDDSFLKTLPKEHRTVFLDEKTIAPAKLKVLRKMIEDRFPATRIINYSCKYLGEDKDNKIKLGVDANFREKVYEFFKGRIEQQYPLIDREVDPFQKSTELHEAFMKNKSSSVVGITNMLKKISHYIGDTGGLDVPLLLIAEAGTGKTSIMAKAADQALTDSKQGKLQQHVFYHFVGAVAGSTDLEMMLKRLLKQLEVVDDSSMPKDLESTVQLAAGALNNPSVKPAIIFVDAANQFDSNNHATLMTWLPRKLAPKIRVILSMIPETPPHQNLMKRETKPAIVVVPPLNLAARKDIICEILGNFQKKLDMDQMICLLSKKSSENPLWLSIACEELRLFGNFREVGDKVNQLADGLLDLIEQVLTRFEEDNGGHLLVATLCLLEASNLGLLESELLQLLADEDNLMPPTEKLEKGSKEKYENEKHKKGHSLPAFKWAMVYRALRTFLRPYGDSGEGRLDFYHRSLSKAVRRKYLKMPGLDEHNDTSRKLSQWWHRKLAQYFEHSEHLDRQIEEYPYNLIKINDKKRLEAFLTRWDVFDKLYNKEYSTALINYWNNCGGYTHMADIYSEALQELRNNSKTTTEQLSHRCNQVARILIQAGIYDPALELATNAMQLEKEQLGERPEKMAEFYSSIAYVWDQKVKLHEFVSKDQLPEEWNCIETGQKAIDLYRQLQDKDIYHKSQLAMQLIKQAFSYASWCDCGGNQELSAQKALDDGIRDITEAINICQEIKDNGKLAEAYMTNSVLLRYDRTKQIKLYNKALEISQQSYGEYHMLTARIYFNTAIVYEDDGEYEKAYNYFKKNCDIVVQIFGPEHVKAQRAKGVLSEQMYATIARRKGHVE